MNETVEMTTFSAQKRAMNAPVFLLFTVSFLFTACTGPASTPPASQAAAPADTGLAEAHSDPLSRSLSAGPLSAQDSLAVQAHEPSGPPVLGAPLRPGEEGVYVFQDEYMSSQLTPIRLYRKRVDAYERWDSVDTLDVFGENSEGIEVVYYGANEDVYKMQITAYGELGKGITAAYYHSGTLVFVEEKSFDYTHPIYDPNSGVKEAEDEPLRVETYFESGGVIRQMNSQDCGAPFLRSYLNEEEARLLELTSHYLSKLNR